MVYDTFTAANTAKGFFSFFDEFLYSDDIKRAYLIKGGPGCGKSTFMKKVADHFDKKGFSVERVLCSSDVGSLDGVKIKEKGIVIIDATSPHAYDMKYPGALESIIDFSIFWDEKILEKDLENIKCTNQKISTGYQNVYLLLKAAGYIEQSEWALTERFTGTEKINKTVKKLLKQNAIIPIENKATVQNRMLSAFSGSGIITLSETTEKLCDEYIVLEDQAGIGHIYLSKLASLISKMGYDTVRIHSPLLPENRLEQVLIPSVRLGFITAGHVFSPAIDQNKITKKINTKTALDKELFNQNKNKISSRRKAVKDLINSVCTELYEIKGLHDRLEEYYINAVCYEKLNSFTELFINKL